MSGLITCPSCGSLGPDNARFCPGCGLPVAPKPPEAPATSAPVLSWRAHPTGEVSYTERYAGTAYAPPEPEPAFGVTPAAVRLYRRRVRIRRLGIALACLTWLPQAIGTIFLNLYVLRTGSLFGLPMRQLLGPLIFVDIAWGLVYLWIGLKILLEPGPKSVGCTGVMTFLVGWLFVLPTAFMTGSSPWGAIWVGVLGAAAIVIGFIELAAAWLMD